MTYIDNDGKMHDDMKRYTESIKKEHKETNKDKNNWPDRVWIENLNGAYIHATNASLTDPKLDPHFTDHRVMREYVLRSVADKHEQLKTAVAYNCGYEKAKKEFEKEQTASYVRGLNQNRFDHDMDLERIKTEILKPIREAEIEMASFITNNPEYSKQDMLLKQSLPWKAIKETLDLADKVGK